MCGRYELHTHPAAIALAFGLDRPPDVHARYNIAPMTEVPVVRTGSEGRRELVRMRWGLVCAGGSCRAGRRTRRSAPR